MCIDWAVNWLDHSRTFREQGVEESETLLLRRKFFYSDQNVDSRDPVQLNLLYVQVNQLRTPFFCWWSNKTEGRERINCLTPTCFALTVQPAAWFVNYQPNIHLTVRTRQHVAQVWPRQDWFGGSTVIY